MHTIKRLTPRLFLGLWVLTVGLGLMPHPLQAATAKPQELSTALKARLEPFLQRLRAAAQSRSFQQLAPLIAPGGLTIGGRMFKDAGIEPRRQTPAIVPLWYASDVSLTMGTAWQLLIEGTRPPPVKASWDKASKSYKVGVTQGQPSVSLEDQGPLLPTHLEALKLAPVVRYITGDPRQLEGFPSPANFKYDPPKTPFSWVFQIGPNRYQLMQFDRVGLSLEVTDLPGEGMRLSAVDTQNPY